MESESLLARLKASRIALRRESETAQLDAIEIRRSGRYQVLGRLASGGMAQVLQGRDTDLGRDVALKVLHPDHLADPELVRRFVEEAQIGGQLQHPGIVPVFELGLQADERPFFAMRLVKGRTLSALLSERRDPSAERRRLLTVFQQVCQAMAYAHSRGVIHRDLKPANIMVGAFGEVQVVDWGFAKVLAQGGVADERRARKARSNVTRIHTIRTADGSESVAGSIMGTPAYMPPEQALGQIEELDERADIFSLGAILCEILTGQPPYSGTRDDVLKAATQGLVRQAFLRLDASGHDPQLVELAKRCLAPFPQNRLRQATTVADTIAQHLARAGERQKKAELAAIEARRETATRRAELTEERTAAQQAAAEAQEQKAKEERARARSERARDDAEEEIRGRRRVLVVAGTVLLAVLVGMSGWQWIESSAAERARSTIRDVDDALEQAALSKGAGRWSAALIAVQHASELALDADSETRARVEATRQAIEDAKAAEIAGAARQAQHRAIVDRLTEVRLGLHLDPEGTKREFAALFREFGIPVTPEALGAHPEIASDLVAALDDWALLPGADRAVLHHACRALDSDPVRESIRRGALPKLEELADAPPPTIDLAAHALLAAGKPQAAVTLLRPAQARHLGNLWLNFRFARALEALPRPRRSEAKVILAAAAVLRHGSAAIARINAALEEGSDAISEFRGQADYLDGRQWHSFEVSHSAVTNSRRRIYFQKRNVTEALVAHKGGHEWKAAPLEYEADTTFVAETLDEDGNVVDTHTLRIRRDKPAEFLIFDAEGRYIQSTAKGLGSQQSCISCHNNTGPNSYHEPMMSYPKEPEPMRLLIDDDARDLKATIHFLEAFHRGGRVFGPYGAIWIGKLKSDARKGTLADCDRPFYERLKRKFPELMAD